MLFYFKFNVHAYGDTIHRFDKSKFKCSLNPSYLEVPLKEINLTFAVHEISKCTAFITELQSSRLYTTLQSTFVTTSRSEK